MSEHAFNSPRTPLPTCVELLAAGLAFAASSLFLFGFIYFVSSTIHTRPAKKCFPDCASGISSQSSMREVRIVPKASIKIATDSQSGSSGARHVDR